MASRYKLLSGESAFTYSGVTVKAGADGWIRPASAAMELAMIQAGALPSGIVTSEDALGNSAPATVTNGNFGGGGGGGSSTLAGLTDIASYDLGTNNTSVAAIKTTANSASTAASSAASAASAAQTTASAAIPASQKGAANGVASLDGSGKVPTAQLPSTTSGATIASGTLATGSIGSSMDNTTQTAASGATLTLTAGISTPTGFVVDAPSGCTISWGSTFSVNGASAAAGSLTVPSGGFAVFRQKQGTDAYWIAQGPNTDALTERTEDATVSLAAADLGGLSLTPVACAVTVGATLGSGFWRGFKGAGVVSFTASGTTVTDERVAGSANPFCMLVATNSAGTTFSVVGNKA